MLLCNADIGQQVQGHDLNWRRYHHNSRSIEIGIVLNEFETHSNAAHRLPFNDMIAVLSIKWACNCWMKKKAAIFFFPSSISGTDLPGATQQTGIGKRQYVLPLPCMINFEIAYKKGTRSWIALIHENQQTQAQITTRNCVKITCLVTSNIHQQSSYHPSIYTTHGADEKETWRSRTVVGLGEILIQLTSNKMRLHSGHQNENNSCSLMPNIFMVKDKPMLLRSGIGP